MSRLILILALAAQFSASAAALCIGHRGNCMFAPENTLASFAAAAGKATLIEFDVRATADGQLIVCHDATVDRTTDGTGAISTNTLANLRLLDAGSWFAPRFAGQQLPTFEEALGAILPGATPLIHHYSGTPDQYLAVLRRLNAVTNVVLQSFDWNFLAQVHALEPSLPLAGLGMGALTSTSISNVINVGARVLHWSASNVTTNELAMVHNAGLSLWVWTVDGAQIPTYLNLGVDGITSDDAAMVQSYLAPAPSLVTLGNQLRAYWKFDDALNNPTPVRIADSKGTNSGIFQTTAPVASQFAPVPAAKFGECAQIAGTNSDIQFPISPDLNINANALTISGWVKLRDLPSTLSEPYASIFDSVQDSYVLYLDKASGQLKFKITTALGNALRPGIPEALLQTGQWLHLCGTFDGAAGPCAGQAVIYLNGVAQDVKTATDFGGSQGATGDVLAGQAATIGCTAPGGSYQFFGSVDDFAVWARALSPLEVQQIYLAGQQGLSLGNLLPQSTSLLRMLAITAGSPPAQLQISFQNLGPWGSFTLLRSSSPNGPFVAVSGLTPVLVDKGTTYQFNYTSTGQSAEFFRIAAN